MASVVDVDRILDPVATVRAAGLSADDQAAVLGGNAERLV
jgi:hypothetical protein